MDAEPFKFEISPVSLQDIVRYAGASGDFNPMHYDAELARRHGYHSNFVQGMFTAGLVAVNIGERFGPEAIRSMDVRFRAPLLQGESVSVACNVRREDHSSVAVRFEACAAGSIVIAGGMSFDVRE